MEKSSQRNGIEFESTESTLPLKPGAAKALGPVSPCLSQQRNKRVQLSNKCSAFERKCRDWFHKHHVFNPWTCWRKNMFEKFSDPTCSWRIDVAPLCHNIWRLCVPIGCSTAKSRGKRQQRHVQSWCRHFPRWAGFQVDYCFTTSESDRNVDSHQKLS